MGFHPQIVDISEFEKLEGRVTCLSVRLRSAISAPLISSSHDEYLRGV